LRPKKTRLCPRGSSIESHRNHIEQTDSKCRSTKSKDDDIVNGNEILPRLQSIHRWFFEICFTANSEGKSIKHVDIGYISRLSGSVSVAHIG
jgi:hypothetical protein